MSGLSRPEVEKVLETIAYLYTESRRFTKKAARRSNLTGPQLTVVKLLEEVGEVSLSELSERIRAQNSTVTGIVDRMEREGMVVRARSAEDRRVVRIRLTEKGQAIARDTDVEPMAVFRDALGSLSAEEVKELERVLEKVAKRMAGNVKPDRPSRSRQRG